jgi:hypothetical protein
MSFVKQDSDDLAISTIRILAADVVAKSNSGHPGAPMGMAPVAHILFSRQVLADLSPICVTSSVSDISTGSSKPTLPLPSGSIAIDSFSPTGRFFLHRYVRSLM